MSELDRQVAEVLGYKLDKDGMLIEADGREVLYLHCTDMVPYTPSKSWLDCGALVEEYKINLVSNFSGNWIATPYSELLKSDHPDSLYAYGEEAKTPCEAICKAVIALKEQNNEQS